MLHLPTTSDRQVSSDWHCGNCLSVFWAVWHLTHLLLCEHVWLCLKKTKEVVAWNWGFLRGGGRNVCFGTRSLAKATKFIFWVEVNAVLATLFGLAKWKTEKMGWGVSSLVRKSTHSYWWPGQNTRLRLTNFCDRWGWSGMGNKRMEAINKITTLCKINCVLCKRLANGRICINVRCWSPWNITVTTMSPSAIDPFPPEPATPNPWIFCCFCNGRAHRWANEQFITA